MKKNYRFFIFFLSLVLILTWSCSRVFSQGIRLNVLKDVYVLPAAELVTTKTYPDIIEMENKYIKVSILPNRGRLIFAYLFKPTGNTQIYTSTRPSPTMTPAGYVVEFGGYYLSIPWNPRARQPYDLKYKIVDETSKKAKVYIWGKDPLRKLFLESWVTVKAGSSLVKIKVKITNKSRRKWRINLSDYLVLTPGGKFTENTFLLLPAKKVVIGKSEKEWMGRKGSVVNWPQSWVKLSNFEKLGSFSVATDKMQFPFVGISNLDRGDAFIKLWEPANFFDSLTIWSWGKEYKRIKGAAPTVNFENKKRKLVLAPKKEISFNVYFYSLRAMREIGLANRSFAGWVDTDKKTYDLAKDTYINVSSQIGATREYKNVSVVYFLCKEKEKIGRGVWGEDVRILSPDKVYKTNFKINIGSLKKGKYILKIRIFDPENKVIFQGESPVFTVK